MQRVKVLKTISYNGTVYKKGAALEVPNNDAHTLIEKGMVKLYSKTSSGKSYSNKQMVAEEPKKYKVKGKSSANSSKPRIN